jgi:hypothetical protein
MREQALVNEPKEPLQELEQLLVSVAKPTSVSVTVSESPLSRSALGGVLALAIARGDVRGLATCLRALLPAVFDIAHDSGVSVRCTRNGVIPSKLSL